MEKKYFFYSFVLGFSALSFIAYRYISEFQILVIVYLLTSQYWWLYNISSELHIIKLVVQWYSYLQSHFFHFCLVTETFDHCEGMPRERIHQAGRLTHWPASDEAGPSCRCWVGLVGELVVGGHIMVWGGRCRCYLGFVSDDKELVGEIICQRERMARRT